MTKGDKKTLYIWEDANLNIETDKESASLDGPSEKSIPDFSETAPRPLRLGDSASNATLYLGIPPSPGGANSGGFL